MHRTKSLNARRTGRLLIISAIMMVAVLNACALKKAMQMNSYESFAEVSNSVWVNLYFTFHEIKIPGYGQIIHKDSVWTTKDSPVILDQNVYILPGVTLTIQPGVKVIMAEQVKLTCRGIIKALGSKEDPILFTSNNEGSYWDSIECLNATDGNPDFPGAIEFKHCIVEYGKGLRINSSHMEITDSVFRNHISSSIQIEYASGRIAGNLVYGNSTARQVESGNGAGIKVFTNRAVTVENNTVHDNVSAGGRDGGGGIYAFAYDGGKVTVVNNTVTNNRSDRKGGGIFAYDALVEGNIVKDNESAMTGGGIYALQAVAQDNVITGNRSDEGGGVFSRDADIRYNLIQNNRAVKGAGIYHLGSGTIEKNTLVQNDGTGADADAAIVMLGNAPVHRNNIVAGRGYALSFQSHNLSPDLDARENFWGTDDETVIEHGVYDWLEDSRVGLVNWKGYATSPIAEAYPFPEDASPRYTPEVRQPAAGTIRGVIEENTLLGGNGSVAGYTVVGNLLVQEGSTLTLSKNTSLNLKEGISIRVRGRLIAQGKKNQPVVFTGDPKRPWDQLLFENRSLDTAQQASESDSNSTLRYCIVENGTGIVMDGKGADLENCRIQNNRGTGVRIKEVAVTVKGCHILNNTSESDGGGIYAYGSRPIDLIDNVVENNTAKDGGGIFAYGYQSNVAVDMRNNRVQANVSQGDGGGIWASRSAMVGNTIMGNRTQNRGGGLYASFALVEGNTIENNTALEGGGIYGESNNRFIGNTIVKNTSLSKMGGGVYLNYWGLSKDNKVFSNNLVERNKTKEGQGTGGICLSGDMDFARNAIFNNTGLQLNNLTPLSIGAIKADKCFWGTIDLKKIDGFIRDGQDDSALSVVQYEPVATTEAVIREKADTE